MAPQPPGAPSPRNGNGNGERLELRLGSKSVGLKVKDLVPILLICGGIVAGYLLWNATDRRLEALITGQDRLHTTIDANKETVIEALHLMQAFLTSQVAASQQRILDRDQASQDREHEALEVLQQMLRTHEFNAHQAPENRLPLDLPADLRQKPAKPGP